jgi:hypothetical protein
MIYQTHMGGWDMDCLPVEYLCRVGNKKVIIAIDGQERGRLTERALCIIYE